jgi:hypothetical protein
MKRVLVSVVGASAAAVLLAACGSTTDAVVGEPSLPSNSGTTRALQLDPDSGEFWERQAEMSEWVTSVIGTGYESTTGLPEGFAGVQMNPEIGAVVFAWKGPVPESAGTAIASPPQGISASTTDALFSRSELVSARNRLESESSQLDATGAKWTQIGLASDGSGLEVGATPPAKVALSESEPTFSSVAAVPVKLRVETPNVPTGGKRWDRTAPWVGGMGVKTPGGGLCSTAFAGVSGGRSVVLSAYHCGGTGKYRAGRLNGTTGPVLGSVWAGKRSRDSIMISTDGDGRGKVMDGAWNAAASSYRKVARGNYNFNGQLICTDGAATGGHCSVRIDNDNTSFRWSDGTVVSPAIYVTGNLVWGKGDSGGPAWAFFDNARVKVEARGILASGNGGGFTCPSAAFATTCFKAGHYVPIMTAMGDYALKLRTE